MPDRKHGLTQASSFFQDSSKITGAAACLLAATFLTALAPALSAADTLPALPAIPDATARAVNGHDGWLFLPAEIRHLATAAGTPALTGENDPLPAILDFNKALAAKGIRLVILPVPEKSLIRADQLFAAPDVAAAAGYAKATGRFIVALKQQGVDVMDTVPVLSAEAARAANGGDPVYCKTDSHFTPHTTAVLARAIAEHLGKVAPDAVRKPANAPVLGKESRITIQGDLAPDGTKEELAFQGVLKAAGAEEPPATDPTSPVLLLGDSHCLMFHTGGDMLAKGGGLADHLGVTLGGVPEVMAVRGSGATSVRVNLYRKARKEPSFLAKKKVVIWCFAAREFTQSDGWKIVPLP